MQNLSQSISPSLLNLAKDLYSQGTPLAAPVEPNMAFAELELYPIYQARESLVKQVPAAHIEQIKKTHLCAGAALEILRQTLCEKSFQDKLRFWGVPTGGYANDLWWHQRQQELGLSLYRNHITYFEMTTSYPRLKLLYQMLRQPALQQENFAQEVQKIDRMQSSLASQNLYAVSSRIEDFAKSFCGKYSDEDLQQDVAQFLKLRMSYPAVLPLNDGQFQQKVQELFTKAQGLWILWKDHNGKEHMHAFAAFKLDAQFYLYDGALAGLVVYKDMPTLLSDISQHKTHHQIRMPLAEWKVYSLHSL